MNALNKMVCISLLISVGYFAAAQQPGKSALAKQIKTSIAQITNYNYNEAPHLAIDPLCLQTAKKVVLFLSDKKYAGINPIKLGLENAVTTKNKTGIKIYNFSYDCGGTRRRITYPIIQWKNKKGDVFAYNLSAKINCDFYEIHRLKNSKRKIYLLIGVETGDGACSQSVAYVVEIKANNIITNLAAFANRPYLNLCNIDYTFIANTQTLYGEYRVEDDGMDLLNSIKQQGIYSVSGNKNRALYVMLKAIYNDNGRIEIKFNGNKFVRISNSEKDIRP